MRLKSLCILLLSLAFTNLPAAERPNVVLIMVDDMNDYSGHLGGHPQAITPHLDALAESGVRFVNAHCNAQICAPSRASMLTGIYPHVSQNYWFDEWQENPILKNCKTLGEFLKDNGYHTYGTGKLMHKDHPASWTEYGLKNFPGPFPFNGRKPTGHPSVPQPFRDLGQIDGTYASLADVPHVEASDEFPGYKGWMNHQRKPFRYVNEDDRDLMNDELQANWAVERLQQLSEKEEASPFFLAVGFSRPHTPLIAPQKFFDLYPLDKLQFPPIQENDREDCHFASILPKWPPPWFDHYKTLIESYPDNPEEGIKRHLQAYLACISFVDEQVGKVTQALEESSLRENTVVVFVSDHGYHQGEKQFLYKNSLWEESTRVPMIVRVPKLTKSAGRTVSHPVSLIDVYPTITHLCSLAKVDNRHNEGGSPLSGHSLVPLLKNPKTTEWSGPKVALSVVKTPSPANKKAPSEHSYAVRSATHRYIHYVSGKEELYHHTNDPNEWTNLADNPEHAAIKAELKAQMEALTGDLDETTFKASR